MMGRVGNWLPRVLRRQGFEELSIFCYCFYGKYNLLLHLSIGHWVGLD